MILDANRSICADIGLLFSKELPKTTIKISVTTYLMTISAYGMRAYVRLLHIKTGEFDYVTVGV